jgi:hypothetical protein
MPPFVLTECQKKLENSSNYYLRDSESRLRTMRETLSGGEATSEIDDGARADGASTATAGCAADRADTLFFSLQ